MILVTSSPPLAVILSDATNCKQGLSSWPWRWIILHLPSHCVKWSPIDTTYGWNLALDPIVQNYSPSQIRIIWEQLVLWLLGLQYSLLQQTHCNQVQSFSTVSVSWDGNNLPYHPTMWTTPLNGPKALPPRVRGVMPSSAIIYVQSQKLRDGVHVDSL